MGKECDKYFKKYANVQMTSKGCQHQEGKFKG